MFWQHIAEQVVHAGIGVTHRHGAKGIAVIAVAQRHHFLLVRSARGVPVLDRHFQCDFHRHRAGIAEEHAIRLPGVNQVSSCASFTAGVWVRPPNMTWDICPNWSRTAR